jgi:hypothetical protein
MRQFEKLRQAEKRLEAGNSFRLEGFIAYRMGR